MITWSFWIETSKHSYRFLPQCSLDTLISREAMWKSEAALAAEDFCIASQEIKVSRPLSVLNLNLWNSYVTNLLHLVSYILLINIFLFSFWKCEQHTFWSIKSKPFVIPLFSKSDLNRKFHFVVINVIDWSNECIYVNNCVPFVWKRNWYKR